MLVIIMLLKKSGLSQTCLTVDSIALVIYIVCLYKMLLLGHKREKNNALRPEGESTNRYIAIHHYKNIIIPKVCTALVLIRTLFWLYTLAHL